jgi:hypothetical protein
VKYACLDRLLRGNDVDSTISLSIVGDSTPELALEKKISWCISCKRGHKVLRYFCDRVLTMVQSK